MRLHRFIGDFNLKKDRLTITDKEIVSQIKNVLRLKPEGQFILCDGKKNEALVTITGLSKDQCAVEVIERTKNTTEPNREVILYCAILKKDNFELVVQKATEIGVTAIVPVKTTRTIKTNLNQKRLEKIAREASEQSGRGHIPDIWEPITFEQALWYAKKNDTNIFFDTQASHKKLKIGRSTAVGIFVGPEGGWDEKEIELAHEARFQFGNLGTTTLRAETAAIVASYATINS